MARILGVTFETTTQSRPGAFSIPRAAATMLGIGPEDPVELRVTWEGGRLEVNAELRSGWEVYPRSSDPSTRGLEQIPPRTPLTVTVWRSGEALTEPSAESDDWSETNNQLSVTRRPSSQLGLRYQRLFQGALQRFKVLRPGTTARSKVGTDNWLDFSAGRSGFLFSWSMARNKYFRVELYIDVEDQSKNKQYFDRLRARESELEEQLGLPISWERLDARRASRIAVYHDVPGDDFDTDPELAEWAAQTMARLVDVMSPVVKGL